MPTIHLTNNTTLDLTASSADDNATLNRYLTKPQTFITPAGFDAFINQKVGDLDSAAFPFTATATADGQFAFKQTSLDVQLGASASIGLLTGDDNSEFLGSLQVEDDPATAGVVSFGLQATLTASDSAGVGDFSLGISKNATVSLTSFCTAPAAETYVAALGRAIKALTIPCDLADLKSLPENAICQIDAASSLQFTASVSYSILNDPLATKSIPKLPTITVNASADATLEGTVTHRSDHTVTIAKVAGNKLHLSVSLTKTDDFETSLTVSAGLEADVGSQDALAFLLARISPNAAQEAAKLKSDLPAKAQQLSADTRTALEAAMSNSLQVSLKAALDNSVSKNRLFLYEIDLTALDATSTAVLTSALRGDFTRMTSPGAALAGIRELDSALTVTSAVTHSLAVHLLGIFNWESTNTFLKQSTVDFTSDTREIVFSDETIELATSSLTADKLRQVVVKGITLTLPASANTPEAPAPINMVFFDRQAATSTSVMRQFSNVLAATGSPGATAAKSLLGRKLKNYGASSLYLGLDLNPAQCRQLFFDSLGKPLDRTVYIQNACGAEVIILTGDDDNQDRLKLYAAGLGFWNDLEDAGSAPNINRLLSDQRIRQNAVVDVITVLWWSSAMARYAGALARNQPLEGVAKDVVKEGTLGFNEPWLILTAWLMLGKPAVDSLFKSSLLALPEPASGHVAAKNA